MVRTRTSLRPHLPLLGLVIALACIVVVVLRQDHGRAGTVTASWASSVGGAPVAYFGSEHVVVVTDPVRATFDLLRGVSITSGQVLWRTQVNDWTWVDVLAAGPDSILVDESDQTSERPGIALLRVDDGSLLWTRTRAESGTRIPASVAGERVLLPTSHQLVAYDRLTGGQRWSWHAASGCSIVGADSAANLAAVTLECANHHGVLVLLDARSGAVRAHRELGDPATSVSVAAGVVAVGSESSCRILDADGRNVTRLDSLTCQGPRQLWTAGDVVVLSTYTLPARVPAITAVDRRSGVVRWQLPLDGKSTTLDGDLLRVIAPGPAPISPTLSYAIDAHTGVVQAVRALPGHDALSLLGGANVVAALPYGPSGGHLELVAPGSGSSFLGGAPAAAWPDPCELLDESALQHAYPGQTFRALPKSPVPWLAARRPLACRFLAADESGTLVIVNLLWMGKSAAQSAQIFDGINTPTSGLPIEGLGDQAVLTRLPFSVTDDTVNLRSNLAIVQLSVNSGEQELPSLARNLIDNLSPQPGGRP